MPTLTIRNVDAATVERLKARARAHRRSLEAELREVVSRAVNPLSADEVFRLADEIAARTRGRPQTDSGLLQRDGRDELERRGEPA